MSVIGTGVKDIVWKKHEAKKKPIKCILKSMLENQKKGWNGWKMFIWSLKPLLPPSSCKAALLERIGNKLLNKIWVISPGHGMVLR